MALPPPDPNQPSASDDDEDESESDDESSSNAPKGKMKGAKENPLRRWAATKEDAQAIEPR